MRTPFVTGLLAVIILCYGCHATLETSPTLPPVSFSGVYPHLAYYNNEGECGTGAVVPWADRLWVITYGPHLPNGSSDKLYEITADLVSTTRPESTGGTPANRMIHRESNQLFIGPYAIDADRTVRVIPYEEAPGRYTGTARHLTDPANKIYMATMEEGFYEVDVHSLETTTLYEDGNSKHEKGADESANQPGMLLPGAHGKGVYSGQGVLVYSNNGEASPMALKQFDIESGVLAEWNGQDWKVVRRSQFVEVTGPGGIYGNPNPDTDPIWATGWDHRSLLLGVRDNGSWHFYRLPKASHSYDGAHGWNTEWPRIRDVGTAGKPDYLMTMHGLFWKFPATFSSTNAAGLRPRSAYLKVIGDFTRWNDHLVFGCDDSAQKEFLNKRAVKGEIEGPGQSNSNLWFTSAELPDQLGPATAEGAVWLNESIDPDSPSEPFLFSGWDHRTVWIQQNSTAPVTFSFEVDQRGNNEWSTLSKVTVPAKGDTMVSFTDAEKGEWIRVRVDRPTVGTVHFYYTDEDERNTTPDAIFKGLANVDEAVVAGGLLYGRGDDKRTMGVAVTQFNGDQKQAVTYYELDAEMNLEPRDEPEVLKRIVDRFAIPDRVVELTPASVLVKDDLGRRWRLPWVDQAFGPLTQASALRVDREVATERDLMNCAGTFYELPAENADGFAKIRPVASHRFRIHDYASYRGLLIMTGVNMAAADDNPHIIRSADGKAAVWAGVIDDLWKLGKPVGRGGPWKDDAVKAGVPSDPYLIGGYDQRSLALSHRHADTVTFRIEVEPVGHGPWMHYLTMRVAPGETAEYTFAPSFQSRWIRFVVDADTHATAWLIYQ